MTYFQIYNQTMLTTDDKKFIVQTITFAITENNKVLDKKFDNIDKKFDNIDKKFDNIDKKFDSVGKRFDSIDKRFVSVDKRFDKMEKKIDLLSNSLNKLAEETVELFNITNKRLEEVNINLSNKIDTINGVIVNHENRIEKLEENSFVTTTNS